MVMWTSSHEFPFLAVLVLSFTLSELYMRFLKVARRYFAWCLYSTILSLPVPVVESYSSNVASDSVGTDSIGSSPVPIFCS